MATRTVSIGNITNSESGEKYVTLAGADREGHACNAHIYLECEVDDDNKRARVRIKRIMMDIWPRYYAADNGNQDAYLSLTGQTSLYKTSTAKGSWVQINGQTLFNCSSTTGNTGYVVNTHLNYYTYPYMGQVCPSGTNIPTASNGFSTAFSDGAWIYYTGSKTISVQGYFTWATSKNYPLDTTGGIDTSVNVTLPTISNGWTLSAKSQISIGASNVTSNPTTSVNLSLSTYTCYRYPITFSTAGKYTITSYASSYFDVKAWFGTSTTFDSTNGEPSSHTYVDDDSGGNGQFSMDITVSTGTTYYLYVRPYSTTTSGSISITIRPNYGYGSFGQTVYNLSGESSYNFSLGVAEVNYLHMTFAASGTATFQTTGSMDTYGFLSVWPEDGSMYGVSSDEGKPSVYHASNDDDGASNNFLISYNVVAGKKYRLYFRAYSMSATGSGTLQISAPIATKTINVISNNSNAKTSGSGTYNIGDSVTVSLTLPSNTAQYNYSFDGWVDDDNDDGSIIITLSHDNPYTFTLSTSSPTNLKGRVAQAIRSYTITTEKNSYINSVTSGSTYNYGTSITLTATLPSNTAQYSYSFDGWYNGNTKVSSNLSYTFTVTGAVTLTAKGSRSVRTYLLTYSAGDYISAVTGTTNSNQYLSYGSSVTLTATLGSATGYTYSFDGWYNGNTKVSSNLSYTFTITGATTLIAKGKRAINYYDLNISSDNNSSIIVYGSSGAPYEESINDLLPYQEQIEIEVSIDEGYWPKTYSISGVSGNSVTGDVSISITTKEAPLKTHFIPYKGSNQYMIYINNNLYEPKIKQ